MDFSLHLIAPLLLISSSLANPIPLERSAPWPPEDIGILEQNAPESTIPLAASGQMTCDNMGAGRCLLFPIGCVPGVNCTDRLVMRKVDSGSNLGDIIISLNLHVSRTANMLVAVPMPDLLNPNSTYLVGCSIDDGIAVVAKPDVDGVTEQLQLPWLRLVAVRATSDDLECIVSAASGHVDLPQGDVAVFAGDLLPEEEVRQSARIAGSLDEETTSSIEEKKEEEREGRERETVEVESAIQKISSPHPHERTTHSLQRSESTEPILVAVEEQNSSTTESIEPILVAVVDQKPSTTTTPESTTVPSSKKTNKLRLKMLHSSESSSAEHSHRHSSAEKTHSTHASVHHETTSTTTTTTTTPNTTTTTEATEVETPEQSTTERVEEREQSTTVLSPHHNTHHGDSHEHHKENHHHSHERPSVDKEHHSVRMEPVTTTTTTTEKPAPFEDDKDFSDEDKQLLRTVEADHVKKEGEEEDEETDTTHADGTAHHRHATVYELSREAAQDPIGRRPSEHSHSHEHRAADVEEEQEEEEEEDEHTKKHMPSHSHEEKKEEREGGVEEERERMGEKKHQRRSEETDDDKEDEIKKEDDDDSTSSCSLMVAMIICIAPLLLH